MGAVILMAMSSTLSAQSMQGKDGVPGPSTVASKPVTAVNPDYHYRNVDLSGAGAYSMQSLVSGWCGTDTTVIDNGIRARIHLQLLAALLSGTSVFPGSIAAKVSALRLWYQSSIDVLPPR
jgi:hypothetical protein